MRKVFAVFLIAAILFSIVTLNRMNVQAPEPTTIGVEPKEILDLTLVKGQTFKVEVWIRNVVNLAGVELKLGYNTTVLNATLIEYGGIFGATYFKWISEIYDVEEYVYSDVDNSGTVTIDDVRLNVVPPYTAGSTVAPSDADIGESLVIFVGTDTPYEKHRENVNVNNVYDPGEYIYSDRDNSGAVTVGDVRLCMVPPYSAGSSVATGDADIGSFLVTFKSTANPFEKHRENARANGQYDAGGYLYYSITEMFGEPAFTGDGRVANITFTVDSPGESLLDLFYTSLGDDVAHPIDHLAIDGYFANSYIHDVAVTDVAVSTDDIVVKGSVLINVTVKNEGNLNETFTVTPYCNNTVAAPLQTVTDMVPRTLKILAFTWDVADVLPGTYTISANASMVAGEADIADNSYADGTVTVEPTIRVEPRNIVDLTLVKGQTFTVKVWARNIADLAGVEFMLGYNTTILTATQIEYGGIFGDNYLDWISSINDAEGWLHYGITRDYGQPSFNGSAVVATITFEVAELGSTVLDLYETKLGNSAVPPTPIVHTAIDGFFLNAPFHDIAITDVTPSTETVPVGQSMLIAVDVKNEGNVNETFTVTAYYNETTIGTKDITDMISGSVVILSFDWNTTDVALGNYTIKAKTSIIPDDIDPADNELVYGGFVEVVQVVHDIAVTGVVASPPTILVGGSVSIEVTVKNEGNVAESFSVTAYYNTTAVTPSQTVTNLSPTESKTLEFLWGTSSVALGNYTMRAEVPPVAGETDVADNIYVDGVVAVTVHDIAVISVTASPALVAVGQSVTIQVTVRNEGNYTESFSVTARSDNSIIGEANVFNLARGASRTLSFPWNTAGVNSGLYTISATASTISGETDITDNNLSDGKVAVKETIAVSISTDPTTLTLGDSVTINGSITPTHAGASVTIWYRRSGENDWSSLATTQTNDNGQYSYEWTPTGSGTFEVKASWAGDAATMDDESETKTVTIQEAPESGIPWYFWYLIAGIIIVIAAVVLVYFMKFRKPARGKVQSNE